MATHSFNIDKISILRRLLKEKFESDSNVHKDGDKDTLYISKGTIHDLYDFMHKNFPISMLYKVNSRFTLQECKKRYSYDSIHIFREKNFIHNKILDMTYRIIECKTCRIFFISSQKIKLRNSEMHCIDIPKFKCDRCLSFNEKSLLSFHKKKGHERN